MIEWLLKTRPFKAHMEERDRNLYTRAFRDAYKDLEEARIDDIEEKSEEKAKEKLEKLLTIVDYKKVVTVDKNHGIVLVNGERLNDSQIGNLRAEAEAIVGMEIWTLLCETPKALAEKAMFVNGTGLEDLQKGRSILYTLDAQKKIIDTFRSAKR